MGEASRRKAKAQLKRQAIESAADRVSHAIRKLATAASPHLGSDCYLHAVLGQALLSDQGINSRLQAGYSAWRVGPGSGDVVSHTSRETGYLPPGVDGFAYHVWLRIDDFLLDFTTYQLPKKAADLDAADHGVTAVEWAPSYLLCPIAAIMGYREAAQSYDAGVFYYEPIDGILDRLAQGYTQSDEDLETARLLMANPDLQVIGLGM